MRLKRIPFETLPTERTAEKRRPAGQVQKRTPLSRYSLFLLPLLLLAASCAPRGPMKNVFPLERQWPEHERVLRHAVRVDLPGTRPSFSFDGIIRLRNGETGPEIRVVCLGPFGLTLCDMTVTPNGYKTDALHPSLARVPHVAEHIVLCVGSIWFAGSGSVCRDASSGLVFRSGCVPEKSAPENAPSSPDGTRNHLQELFTSPRIIFYNEEKGYTVTIRSVGRENKREGAS